MPEPPQGPGTTDGRRLKGERRSRTIIDATVRVIERAGVAGVSQRVVAAEAGVPPSAVAYYFPTVDDLLLAALTDVNDACLAELARCAEAPDRLDALTTMIIAAGRGTRAAASAEFELFLLAGRGERWRREYERWAAALDEFFAPWHLDEARAARAAAAIDGLWLRAHCVPDRLDHDHLRATLNSLVDPEPARHPSSRS